MDWQLWCRFCGSYDTERTEKIHPEIDQLKLFNINLKFCVACFECNSYMKDFLQFYAKTQKVNALFEDLERVTESEPEIDKQFIFQLRELYELPVPLSTSLDSDDFAIIQQFPLIDVDHDFFDEEHLDPEIEETFEATIQDYLTAAQTYTDLKEEEESSQFHFQVIPEDSNANDNNEYQLHSVDQLLPAVDNELNTSSENDVDEEVDEIYKHFTFLCHVCNETIHTQEIHNCMPKVNCICGKVIRTKSSLVSHYESHYGKTKLRCEECKKHFKTQSKYDNHRETFHRHGARKAFNCNECGKLFIHSNELIKHKKTHLPDDQKFIHHCDFCERQYSSVFSLRQHVKHVHIKELIYQCEYCEKMFSRKANLHSHVDHVHTSKLNYECDICNLKVKTKGILKNHKKLHSTNPDEFYYCNECLKLFKTQNQLINHMVCHSKEKKYKCSYCPNDYKRSKELTSHIASVHTGLAFT